MPGQSAVSNVMNNSKKKKGFTKPKALFGVIQGGRNELLRKKSAQTIADMQNKKKGDHLMDLVSVDHLQRRYGNRGQMGERCTSRR